MQLKEKIAQSEQEKAQLEHALSAQAKHSQAAEAESASANAKANQLEVRYLPCGTLRSFEYLLHDSRSQLASECSQINLSSLCIILMGMGIASLRQQRL